MPWESTIVNLREQWGVWPGNICFDFLVMNKEIMSAICQESRFAGWTSCWGIFEGDNLLVTFSTGLKHVSSVTSLFKSVPQLSAWAAGEEKINRPAHQCCHSRSRPNQGTLPKPVNCVRMLFFTSDQNKLNQRTFLWWKKNFSSQLMVLNF